MKKSKRNDGNERYTVHSFTHAPLMQPGAHLTMEKRLNGRHFLEIVCKRDFFPKPVKFSVVTNLQILKTHSFTLKDKDGYADTHFLITGSGCLLERA